MKLHTGHLGITRCQEKAKQSVWWPRIGKHIEEEVQKCLVCSQSWQQNVESLLPTDFPDYPWQKVAADLFTWKGTNYLILVDYYSCYIEMNKSSVIQHIKSILARHGIPETFVPDSGPQFSSMARPLPSLLWTMAFTTRLVAPIIPKVMGKQNVRCKQLNGS